MYHTIIVGAGQAGLSTGYYLAKQTDNFLILEKGNEVGLAWKERYDSLILFTSKQFSSLPGLKIDGKPNTLPTKDEIYHYLQRYALNFSLPIKLNTEVSKIEKAGEHYSVFTNGNTYITKNVIIATGPFHHPNIPSFAKNLSPGVLQLHSSEYKNPNQLKEGNVLVVGGGNSGAQIAVELAETRETFISIRQKLKYMPLTIGERSIFWWFDKTGILKASTNSWLGQKIQSKRDPIFGYELKDAISKNKIKVVDRVIDSKNKSVLFKNNRALEFQNIIWATGFKPDYRIVKNIPGVLDRSGRPIHDRGVTNSEGLLFIGLPWQSRRGSALLEGVSYDAEFLMKYIRK